VDDLLVVERVCVHVERQQPSLNEGRERERGRTALDELDKVEDGLDRARDGEQADQEAVDEAVRVAEEAARVVEERGADDGHEERRPEGHELVAAQGLGRLGAAGDDLGVLVLVGRTGLDAVGEDGARVRGVVELPRHCEREGGNVSGRSEGGASGPTRATHL